MSFANKTAEYEAQLDYLLAFISGKIEPYEIGFCTYSLDLTNWKQDKQSKALHRACMELERRGQIERWFECPKLIVWRPKSLILTDET